MHVAAWVALLYSQGSGRGVWRAGMARAPPPSGKGSSELFPHIKELKASGFQLDVIWTRREPSALTFWQRKDSAKGRVWSSLFSTSLGFSPSNSSGRQENRAVPRGGGRMLEMSDNPFSTKTPSIAGIVGKHLTWIVSFVLAP